MWPLRELQQCGLVHELFKIGHGLAGGVVLVEGVGEDGAQVKGLTPKPDSSWRPGSPTWRYRPCTRGGRAKAGIVSDP